MKKRVLLILFCFVLASTLLFAACNTKTEPTAAPVIEETKTVAEVPAAEKSADTSVATDKKTDVKVAMVLSGPINDDDWNSVGYNGLKKACEELGVEFAYSESVTDADAERVIRDYAARGYRLIFAHSFSFGEATLKVAKDFPETIFMAGTANELTKNMGTYDNPDYQGAYLAGMLAAGISKTGTIGWVDGMASPNMLANLHAYQAGALEMNPEIKVLHTFIGSWYDPPKAKEAAIAQIEQGADVLSSQGVGVIDAAIEKKVWALGAMTDQNFMGPDVVLTSVMWDLYPCIKNVTQEVIDGTWKSGNRSYGIADGAVYFAEYHGLDSNIPADVLEKVNAKFDAIKTGEFEVPHDTSEVK